MKILVILVLLVVVVSAKITIESKNVYKKPLTHRPHPINPRIIGGKEAVPHSLPYQMYLSFTDSNSICGGSLISQNYILTAAHCTTGETSVVVYLGAHNVTTQEPTQVRLTSDNLIIHKQYNNDTQENDISLVKLPKAVDLNDNIQTIPLAGTSDNYEGKTAVLAGWGDISNSGTETDVLMRVDLKVIANSKCADTFGDDIKKTNVCTDGAGPKGGCSGDSGGPLVVDGVQIGVASYVSGDGCDKSDPTVFTRVSEYIQWISDNTRA